MRRTILLSLFFFTLLFASSYSMGMTLPHAKAYINHLKHETIELRMEIGKLKQQNQQLNQNNLALQSKIKGFETEYKTLTLANQGLVNNYQQRLQKFQQMLQQYDTTITQLKEKLAPNLSFNYLIRKFSSDTFKIDEQALQMSPTFSEHVAMAPYFSSNAYLNRIFQIHGMVPLLIILALLLILLVILSIVGQKHKVKEKPIAPPPMAKKAENKRSEQEQTVGQGYHYLAGEDVVASKLDLVHAYINMGDKESAKEILVGVLKEGNEAQQAEAQELLKGL